MASVRPGLARRSSSCAAGSLLLSSSSMRSSRKELLSRNMNHGEFQDIQGGEENSPPEGNWAMSIPHTTSEEITSREQQRVKDYEERKASRSARLESITNQWADNRMKNSALCNPRRSSWMRSEQEVDVRRCDYLFCCFG